MVRFPKPRPKKNSKCIHAWEEYKKLDTAHDDLRREYLALRGEQINFSSVSKEWLLRMREFRLRCLELGKNKKDFITWWHKVYRSKDFTPIKMQNLKKKLSLKNKLFNRKGLTKRDLDFLYSSKEFENLKLKTLIRKLDNNQELSPYDIRFLYSVGRWPSKQTKNILDHKQWQYRMLFHNKDFRARLSKALGCCEDQISVNQANYEEALEQGKKIIYHWEDLNLENETDARKLKLPKYVRGVLWLNGLRDVDGLVLPEQVWGLYLSGIKSAKGLHLPEEIGGDLSLHKLINAEGLVLPEEIGGDLYLTSLIRAHGLVLPPIIGGNLYLRSLVSADGLVFPQKIGDSLYLGSLVSAVGLVLPKQIDHDLYLDDLTSIEGLDFSHCRVGYRICLPKVPQAEKDQLRAKYPHLGNRIE